MMQQNETDLTPTQETVLAELMAGRTVTKAAKKAKISRCTIHRWLNERGFRAEYERRKLELRDAVQMRLLTLADRAVSCIESALKNDDEKTALALLKGLDLMAAGGSDATINNAPPTPQPYPEPINDRETQRQLQEMLDRYQNREATMN